MAHMVEEINGVAQMAYAGETPWHGLGTKVPNDLSPIQMMEKAGLDWRVELVDVYAEFRGKQIPTGQKALIRDLDSKVLTTVGDSWKPVQNEEAFDFFYEYCAAGDMNMEVAGSLKGGRQVWVLAKVKDGFAINGGRDQVDSYLLFSNPHQYGKSIEVRFTPIRVVCNNTLTMSLQSESKNMVRINHRTQFDAEQVKTTMGIASEQLAKYKEVADFLSKKRYNGESLVEYFNNVFPITTGKTAVKHVEDLSKNARLAYDSMDTQPGAELGEGSWWQAFNSVTYITDHLMGRSAENRLNSAWFGSNQRRKVEALNLAVEMAEAA